MEIVTVKDAQGAPIEKKVISGLTVDVNTGLISIGHQNAVKRFDGEWVQNPNNGQGLSIVASDFEGTDLTAYNKALNDFKTAVASLAAKKLGV